MPIFTTKFNGRCRSCGEHHAIGDKVSFTPGTKGVVCLACVERGMQGGPGSYYVPPAVYANVQGSPPSTGSIHHIPNHWGKKSKKPIEPPPPPPLLSTLILTALSALEAVIIDTATKQGISAEAESAWKKYQAIKAHCLRPGTPQEEAVALKQALLQAVKLAL